MQVMPRVRGKENTQLALSALDSVQLNRISFLARMSREQELSKLSRGAWFTS